MPQSTSHPTQPVADPTSAREWLAKLISFDTTSSKSNISFIQYVAAYAREALRGEEGTPGAKVLVEYGPPCEGVSYANLVISIPAHQSEAADPYTGGFVLSGHSDCVPVEGQQWDSDPFVLTERDGKLYGRGTCDMKGFLAAALSLVPEWAAAMRAKSFRKPLHLVFTYNEETYMDGCTQLVRDGSEAWRRLAACEGAIIGEPTLMELIIAHKGIHENHVTCRGTAAHSSQQDASFNALEPATRILGQLFAMRDRFTTEGPFDDGFGVPYTTLCPGNLRGGQALNTTPELCTFSYQFRNVPEHDPNVIEREVRSIVGKENVELQHRVKATNEALAKKSAVHADASQTVVSASVEVGQVVSFPHFQGNPEATVVQALQKAVVSEGGEGGSVGAKLQKVSFYTEAGEFQKKGLNTVVCGPGSIDQAHKANEFIAVEQLEKGVRVVRNVIQQLCL